MTTPTLLAEMMKTRVAPALRELGMRGSGQNFRLPNRNGDHALLGFQKGSDGTGRFTANVAFYSGRGWQEESVRQSGLPAAPTATIRYFVDDPQTWWERVGLLMDPAHDHWWTLPAEDEVPAVADHVIAVVRDLVLPQLRARLAGTQLPTPSGGESGPVPVCRAPTCAYPPVPRRGGADLGGVC